MDSVGVSLFGLGAGFDVEAFADDPPRDEAVEDDEDGRLDAETELLMALLTQQLCRVF